MILTLNNDAIKKLSNNSASLKRSSIVVRWKIFSVYLKPLVGENINLLITRITMWGINIPSFGLLNALVAKHVASLTKTITSAGEIISVNDSFSVSKVLINNECLQITLDCQK